MWVKNKKTGLKWEVTGDLAERLSHSPDYIVIDKPVPNLSDFTVDELRTLAKKKGIEGYSDMRKAELIKALEG